MPKVPVLSTVQAAYFETWTKRAELAALATPAVVVLSILTAVIAWGPPTNFRLGLAILVQLIGLILLISPFSVAWLRFLILKSTQVDPRDAIRWGERERRVLGAYVRVTVFSVAALFLIQPFALSQAPALLLVGFAASIGFLVVYSRLLMHIPTAAMDGPKTVAEIWRLTENNGLRLAAIVLLSVLPPLLTSLIASSILTGLATGAGIAETLSFSLIASLVVHGFQFATLAFMLSALAKAFSILTPKQVISST